MEQQEKQMIEGLFDKLQQAEQQTGPREATAEQAIHEALSRQPNAPYYMAQTILVQEHALNNLNQRVQELEQTLAEQQRAPAGGGFLGSLFGAGSAPHQPPPRRAPAGQPAATAGGPFQGARQGSFLGTAMATAVGVAGGMILADALSGAFAGDAAAAEDVPTEAPADDMAAVDEDGDFGDFGDEF